MGGRASRAGKGVFVMSVATDPPFSSVADVLRGLGKGFLDYRPAWGRLVPSLSSGVLNNIAGRGGPIGEGWGSDDPAYTLRKKRAGFGSAALRASGALIRDLSGRGGVLSLTTRRLEFGTKLPYAPAVNFGTSRGVSSRRFMGWNDRMRRTAVSVVQQHHEDLLSRAAVAIKRGR